MRQKKISHYVIVLVSPSGEVVNESKGYPSADAAWEQAKWLLGLGYGVRVEHREATNASL